MPTTTVSASSTRGDGRDRGDHPADEAVDDLQRRDVDEHAVRAGLDDPLGEVLLERERDLVLQVDLDRDQQDVADAQDRDALHSAAPGDLALDDVLSRSGAARAAARRPASPWWRCRRTRCRARRSVCAICGRMPEMMHSAPSSRAAITVLSRCWATWVSTAETPVMSMIACSEPVSTSACSSFSITTWVRAESRVPTSGRRHDAVPELDDRRGQLEQRVGLLGDHLLAGLGVGLEHEQAEVVDEPGELREERGTGRRSPRASRTSRAPPP